MTPEPGVSEALLPCPFCGSEDLILSAWSSADCAVLDHVKCSSCDAERPTIRKWNTRPDSAKSSDLPYMLKNFCEVSVPSWVPEENREGFVGGVRYAGLMLEDKSPSPSADNGELERIIDFLKTLPQDCMGTGSTIQGTHQIEYPIRDEVINNLCKVRAALQSPSEGRVISEALQAKILEALSDIKVLHQDPDSPAYNECDRELCGWCGIAEEIEQALKEQEQ